MSSLPVASLDKEESPESPPGAGQHDRIRQQLFFVSRADATRKRNCLLAMLLVVVLHWITCFRSGNVNLEMELLLVLCEVVFSVCVSVYMLVLSKRCALNTFLHYFIVFNKCIFLCCLGVMAGILSVQLATTRSVELPFVLQSIELLAAVFNMYTTYKAYRSELTLEVYKKTGQLQYCC